VPSAACATRQSGKSPKVKRRTRLRSREQENERAQDQMLKPLTCFQMLSRHGTSHRPRPLARSRRRGSAGRVRSQCTDAVRTPPGRAASATALRRAARRCRRRAARQRTAEPQTVDAPVRAASISTLLQPAASAALSLAARDTGAVAYRRRRRPGANIVPAPSRPKAVRSARIAGSAKARDGDCARTPSCSRRAPGQGPSVMRADQRPRQVTILR
jgi:hypothetical protein